MHPRHPLVRLFSLLVLVSLFVGMLPPPDVAASPPEPVSSSVADETLTPTPIPTVQPGKTGASAAVTYRIYLPAVASSGQSPQAPSVLIFPQTGGTLNVANIRFSIPPGAVSEPVRLTYIEQTRQGVSAVSPDNRLVFELTATTLHGTPVQRLSKPGTLELTPEADASTVQDLNLLRWDEKQSHWSRVDAVVRPETQTILAYVDTLSRYAMVAGSDLSPDLVWVDWQTVSGDTAVVKFHVIVISGDAPYVRITMDGDVQVQSEAQTPYDRNEFSIDVDTGVPASGQNHTFVIEACSGGVCSDSTTVSVPPESGSQDEGIDIGEASALQAAFLAAWRRPEYPQRYGKPAVEVESFRGYENQLFGGPTRSRAVVNSRCNGVFFVEDTFLTAYESSDWLGAPISDRGVADKRFSGFEGQPITIFDTGFISTKDGETRAFYFPPIIGDVVVKFTRVENSPPDNPQFNMTVRARVLTKPGFPGDSGGFNMMLDVSTVGTFAMTSAGGDIYEVNVPDHAFSAGEDVSFFLFGGRSEDGVGANWPLDWETGHSIEVQEGELGPFPPEVSFDNFAVCDASGGGGGGGFGVKPDLPPTVEIVEFWPDGHGNASIKARATDDNGIASVKFTTNVGTTDGIMQPWSGDGIYAGVIRNIPPNETAAGTVTATDTAGQTGSADYDGRVPFSSAYGSSCPGQCITQNPINTATGNATDTWIDLVVPGPAGTDIVIARSYNSQSERDGPFGRGSSFAYDMDLHFVDNPLLQGIQVRYGDGQTANFSNGGSGDIYTAASPGNFEKITKEGDEYVLRAQDHSRSYHFNADGRLVALRNEQDAAITFSYDGDHIKTITNPAGRTVTLTWANGQITGASGPENKQVSYAYNDNKLVTYTDARGNATRYEHDDAGRITAVIDPSGNFSTRHAFDDRGRALWEIVGETSRQDFQYDDTTHTTVLRDILGHTTTYAYDDKYFISSVTNALGDANHSVYDDRGNLVEYTDRRGNTTRYRYDDRGNMIERADPIDSLSSPFYTRDTTTWSYNDRNKVISTTDANGQTTTFDYDAQGNLTAVHEPSGRTTTMTYNTVGQPLTITNANNHTTRYEYNASFDLVRTIDPLGNVTRSTYDAAGRETSFSDGNGHTVGFTYDGNDNITRITDPKGKVTSFVYDANDLLARTVDRRGGETLNEYDKNRNLVGERDEAGNWIRYAYDQLYRQVEMIDQRGHRTLYGHDALDRLSVMTDTIKAVTQYTYDDDGNLTVIADALNQHTETVYDAMGRIRTVIDALGHQTAFVYDAEDRLIRILGPRGALDVTRFEYDVLDQLVALIDPLGNTTRHEYDPVGNQTAFIDPNKHRTDYTYNELNRLVAIAQPTLPDGQRPTTRFEYDPVGNQVAIISPHNHRTQFEFDENDNLVAATDANGKTTLLRYDEEDHPVMVIDANGNAQHTGYDLRGLPVVITDAMGYTTTLMYDAAMNLTQTLDQLGKATRYGYDEANRLVEEIDPLHNVTRYERDLLGRVVGTTDANQHTTGYQYDALDRLTAVIDALGSITSYTYDEANNLTSITNANKQVTQLAYTLNNQLAQEIDPLGNTWRYEYDAAGRLIQRMDAQWQSAFYDYDSNDRLTDVTYGPNPGAQHPLQYRYDLDGNLTQMCDGLGCFANSYDNVGRLTSVTDWLGRTVTHSYDDVGNLASLSYPNGYTARYGYNANNWLTMFTDPHGESSTYEYNPRGQVTHLRHPNFTIADFSYDDAGWLTGIDQRRAGRSRPQSAYAYALDRVGNRTEVTEMRADFDDGGTTVVLKHHYDYDALNRLVNAATERPASATDYRFDAVGNRIAKSGTVLSPDSGEPELPVAPRPEQVGYTYNAANQLTAVTDQQGSTRLDYSANGNRTRETSTDARGRTITTEYVYDHEDRLVEVVKRRGDTVIMRATYTYDGYGRRAIKEVRYPDKRNDDYTITYLYDGLDIIGAQVEKDGKTTESYYYLAPSPVTGMRRPVAMERLRKPGSTHEGDRYWYQTDGLDSIVALTDERGNLTAPFLYDEYGQILAGDTDLQLFTYTAQDYDPETGLVHFHSRYYDPARGVWLTQDRYRGQMLDLTSMHRYGYVGGNPTNLIDILGYGWNPFEAVKNTFNNVTSKVSEAWQNTPDWAKQAASVGVGFIPGVGDAVDIAAAVTGRDPITGEQLSILDRGLSLVGVLPIPGVSGSALRSGKRILNNTPNILKSTKKILSAAPDILSEGKKMLRPFGNVGQLLSNPRIKYSWKNLFFDNRNFKTISAQYWRLSNGAGGKDLHHWLIPNRWKWVPQGIRNAGFNLIELPSGFNRWLGRGSLRDLKEWTLRWGIWRLGAGTFNVVHDATKWWFNQWTTQLMCE